ncbi:Protein of unknown function DUF760 [Cynara cardunculus var. scolymus]|uniref:Uncharacterized protein n=1 Tax=Cynara cardunculus var. scolymus TaxID=59895 RepID=A0A103XL64_CYNCS|nr:Protein of unknown function DUF760 [Cynara cardunculus var. scolymus]
MAAASHSLSAPFSGLTDHRIPHHKPPSYPCSHHLFIRPSLPYLSNASNSRRGPATSVICGVSDDFVSTQNSGSFYHEFSVIANMLKKIEPLDTSVISKGVSDFAKDSMKQMISTMLGLLPSDEFSVTVRVSKRPLVRLLASSLITGYTLWNAEYRILLMTNFETSSVDIRKRLNSGYCDDDEADQIKESEGLCDDGVGMENQSEELERFNFQNCSDDLSPEAMNYIQQLESDLSTAKKKTIQIGYARGSNNDLLKYLKSLDSEMVNELSKPSSSEVKEVLQQLVYCISRRVFKEDFASGLIGDSKVVQENYQNDDVNFSETRDYLVYAIGSSIKRLGEQVISELCSWFLVIIRW